jgi:hypothetical protein
MDKRLGCRREPAKVLADNRKTRLAAAASVPNSSVAFGPDSPMRRANKRVGQQPQLVQGKASGRRMGPIIFWGSPEAAKGSIFSSIEKCHCLNPDG